MAHQALYILDVVFDPLAVLLGSVATRAVEWFYLLVSIVPVVALRLYLKDLVPRDLPAFYREIIIAVTILALYMAALVLTRIPSHPFLCWTGWESSGPDCEDTFRPYENLCRFIWKYLVLSWASAFVSHSSWVSGVHANQEDRAQHSIRCPSSGERVTSSSSCHTTWPGVT